MKKFQILCTVLLFCVACTSPRMVITSHSPLKRTHLIYKNWGQAINDADFHTARQMTSDTTEIKIINAFEALYMGEVDSSRKILEEIKNEEYDYLKSLILPYYFHHGLYQEHQDLARTEEGNTSLSLSFSTASKNEMQWTADEVTLPFSSLQNSGTPIIEVEVNGRKMNFIIDTGWSHTTISEKYAQLCGIQPFDETTKLSDVHNVSTNSSPAIINQLSFGNLTISNQPIYIMKDLSLKFLGISFCKMDGVIGWDILQQLKVEINWKEQYIRLGKSSNQQVKEPNLVGITSPFLVLKDQKGINYYMHFDTGAKQTELFDNSLRKGDLSYEKGRTVVSFGVNSSKTARSKVVKNFTLHLGDKAFKFNSIRSYDHKEISGFVILNGRIGTDLFKNGAIEFDYYAGYLRYFW